MSTTPFTFNHVPLFQSTLTAKADTEKTKTKTDKVEKRCNHEGCKKKLVLSDRECRCGKRFCMLHKFYEDHKCSYNYREASDTVLKKQLEACVGDRLTERI